MFRPSTGSVCTGMRPASAISFTPVNTLLPKLFGPFTDREEMVTPFYWGSHWPLARGNMTGHGDR